MSIHETTTVTGGVGPLAPGVGELTAAGWVALPAPLARRSGQQLVLLAGRGGILVIGTHKSTETALVEFTATVTALLPAGLRAAVLSENGHDLRSLPRLASGLPAVLDEAGLNAAVQALSGADQEQFTLANFLEWTRDARPEPHRRRARGRGERGTVGAFLTSRWMIGLVIILALLIVATTNQTRATSQPAAKAVTSQPFAGGSQVASVSQGLPGYPLAR